MPANRAARLAFLGGIAVFAVLALGSGLDRVSAQRPAAARWVPGLFKAEGWRAEAATQLGAGHAAAATGAAERAVAADPIDPRSTALLGGGHLAQGKQVPADRAFRVAAGFGWRDPLTQLYFMNAALNAGQPRLAALRLDALLRQAPFLPVRDMLFARFEATSEGRGALAERLALRPAWAESFMIRSGNLPLESLQARAAIVAGMTGPGWNCETVEPLATKLISKGAVTDAKALWLAQCSSASRGISDPRFTRLQDGRSPMAFEWNLAASGDISFAPGPDGAGLLVRVSGPALRAVAWQLLVLQPGRYRLTWTAQNPAGETARGTALSLSCAPGQRENLGASDLGKGRFEAVVTIDAACPGRYLTLWQAPAGEDTRIDSFALTPL